MEEEREEQEGKEGAGIEEQVNEIDREFRLFHLYFKIFFDVKIETVFMHSLAERDEHSIQDYFYKQYNKYNLTPMDALSRMYKVIGDNYRWTNTRWTRTIMF